MYNVMNISDLVVRYFSSTPWLVVFIISTVYLFIRMNTVWKRAMLVAIIVFFLFVNSFVISLFTRLGQNATYYRHLWAIPTIALVGIAIVDLIGILPKWYLRIPAIIALALGLWFINEQEYIRCRAQIFSIEGTLVTNDVMELGNKLEDLRKESGKNTLFVVCPIGYERLHGNMVTDLELYNGSIKVSDSSILNDDSHNGEAELTGEKPDVDYIMSTCCSKGIDFVVVSRNEKSENSFFKHNYFPSFSTDTYLVFSCFGYDGMWYELTNWGQIKRITYHDNEGELIE